MNNDSPFLNQLRDSLEGYRADYNPADWSDMEQRLDALNAPAAKPSAVKYGLWGLAGAVVIATAIFLTQPEGQSNQTAQVPVIEEVEEDQSPKTDGPVTMTQPTVSEGTVTSRTDADQEPVPGTEAETVPVEVSTEAPGEETETGETTRTTDGGVVPPVVPAPSPDKRDEENKPHAGFKVSTWEICVGETIDFTAEEPGTPSSFQWNFADGSTSEEPLTSHQFNEAGTYYVRLRVIPELEDNKSTVHTSPRAIVVHGTPEISGMRYEQRPMEGEYYDPSFRFSANLEGASKFVWDFDDNQTSVEENPTHLYRKAGWKTVTLSAESEHGCKVEKTLSVDVKQEYNLLAPSSFSPNNDGINDTWLPVALKSGRYEFRLTINDHQNNVVFISNDPNSSWDGRKRGGQMAQRGESFFWEATVKDKGQTPEKYAGKIIVKQ